MGPPFAARVPSAALAFERFPEPPKAHVLPLSRLFPPEAGLPDPAQLPPVRLPARITLRAVQSSNENTPAPRVAELLVIVTFFRLAEVAAALYRPPPSVAATLPLRVTLVSVIVSSFSIPPPAASDELPLTVTPVSVAVPVL